MNNLDLNTVHLFTWGYHGGGGVTGNDWVYAKDIKEARRYAKSRCARHEKVICLNKVVQRKMICK